MLVHGQGSEPPSSAALNGSRLKQLWNVFRMDSCVNLEHWSPIPNNNKACLAWETFQTTVYVVWAVYLIQHTIVMVIKQRWFTVSKQKEQVDVRGSVCFSARVHQHDYLCGSLFVSVCAYASVCEGALSVGVSSLPAFNQPFNQTARSNCKTSERMPSGFTGWSLRVTFTGSVTHHWHEDRKWGIVLCLQLQLHWFFFLIIGSAALNSLSNQQPRFTCTLSCSLNDITMTYCNQQWNSLTGSQHFVKWFKIWECECPFHWHL